jgi:glycosyltransferase involved in cell wall biosynthesis
MRIAYLARRQIPSKKAHAVQIVKMCEAFARLGHDVRLFALPGETGCTFARYGVERVFDIVTLPKRAPSRWAKPLFLLPLLTRLRQFDADLFYGRDIVSLSLASLLGRPVVYEAHVKPELRSPRGRLLHWLFARSNFSHLVCTTSTLADAYRGDYPELAGKPVVLAPNAAMPRDSRSEKLSVGGWPGRSGHLQVGFVGRPFRGKGIEAMAAAASLVSEADFHIVGAMPEDCDWLDGSMPANLHFHGYQPNGALCCFYKRFDVAAAPYGVEVMNASNVESSAITSPLKLVEYMEAGLPTIVSDLPGVRDVVGSGAFVELIEPGDHDQFAAAIRRLAADPERRKWLGKAARDAYRRRHTTLARAGAVLDAAPHHWTKRAVRSRGEALAG